MTSTPNSSFLFRRRAVNDLVRQMDASEAKAAEEKMMSLKTISNLQTTLDNGGFYPGAAMPQRTDDDTVLMELQSLTNLGRLHTDKLDKILEILAESNTAKPIREIYYEEEPEEVEEEEEEEETFEESAVALQAAEFEKSIQLIHNSVQSLENLIKEQTGETKSQENILKELSTKVIEIFGMISMLPKNNKAIKKAEQLKNENAALHEKLEFAVKQYEELHLEHKTLKETKTAETLPKPNQILHIFFIAIFVVTAFMLGLFFAPQFDIAKQM